MGVAVPLRVEQWVLEPEVAPDVDDPPAIRKPLRGELRGLARGKGGEDDLGVANVAADAKGARRVVEMRHRIAERLARMAARDGRANAHAGGAQQKARAPTSGGTGD